MPNPIKVARMSLGITQRRLAEIVGVSRTTVNHWETGRFTPSAEYMPKLASAFGRDAEELTREILTEAALAAA